LSLNGIDLYFSMD